jgi:plasmid stability protein
MYGLIRQIRVRAARTGRRDSETMEEVLREGLGSLDRLRSSPLIGGRARRPRRGRHLTTT